MRAIEGQRSDSVAIKRTRKEKELQLRQLREQLAALKSHTNATLRAAMEKKIAALEAELNGSAGKGRG